jgi:hypothetical protein
MAVWRLNTPHYLNVPGTEYEYTEVSRDGRQGRSRWQVPRYLNPDDPADQTPFNSGQTFVCTERNPQYPGAILFIGEPTPDMEPIDEEAHRISDSFRGKWKHPVDSLPGNFSSLLIQDLERQMSETLRSQSAPQAVSAEQVTALMRQVEALQDQVATLSKRPDRRV